MNPRKILCFVGIHKYRTIDMTTRFHTTYADKPKWSPVHHILWYQQCSCCGKRKLKDTVKKDRIFKDPHRGVEYARVGWEEYGRMILDGDETRELPPNPPKKSKPTLKVVK